MKKMPITISMLLFAFAAAALFMAGCTRMDSGEALSGDMYRKVPKEVHEHYYPDGHKQDTAFGKDRDCYYDLKANAYWCQYPKPDLKQ